MDSVSFLAAPKEWQKTFNLKEEGHCRPKGMSQKNNLGMFDIRSYEHMDVVISAGLGEDLSSTPTFFLSLPRKSSTRDGQKVAREMI